MDEQDLANKLREMYTHGLARKRAVAMVNLFGIMFAGEIERCGSAPTATAKEIAKRAALGESYGTEIDKGRTLAEYVAINRESILKWRT